VRVVPDHKVHAPPRDFDAVVDDRDFGLPDVARPSLRSSISSARG
jgi:hypothetical protein